MADARPGRTAGRRPDAVFHVMRAGAGGVGGAAAHTRGGAAVTAVRLCEYVERTGDQRGPYSLITAVVETDAGAAELVYDEGYMGADALGKAGRFLVGHLGISALVERAAVSIESGGGGGGRAGGEEAGAPPAG